MKSLRPFRFPKSRPLKISELLAVYKTARRYFGHRHWWPGETTFEIIVGAILTQNTAWTNVEKAIINLKSAKVLSPRSMRRISKRRLANLIRPAGYFNVKATRLKFFLKHFFREFHGDFRSMFARSGERLRTELLSIKGIGPETADSILLYAGKKPFFVIDAYTKRIFARHRLLIPRNAGNDRTRSVRFHDAQKVLEMDYDAWQTMFMQNLPMSVSLYNDFHAQIVEIGKNFCKSSRPRCDECPLRIYL